MFGAIHTVRVTNTAIYKFNNFLARFLRLLLSRDCRFIICNLNIFVN